MPKPSFKFNSKKQQKSKSPKRSSRSRRSLKRFSKRLHRKSRNKYRAIKQDQLDTLFEQDIKEIFENIQRTPALASIIQRTPALMEKFRDLKRTIYWEAKDLTLEQLGENATEQLYTMDACANNSVKRAQ